jgi:GMP synthase (glutamine-hydrolysing)
VKRKVYVITHAEDAGPGVVEGFFAQQGWEEVICPLWRGESLPGSLDSTAGIVMLGGHMNAYQEREYPFLAHEDLFIRQVLRDRIPFLGICLGAQLLAKACGAAVTRSPETERGWQDVRLTAEGQNDPLFRDLPRRLSVFQWHEDAFAVPDSGTLLATGNSCRNQAFRVGGYAYALQFHIEVTTDIVKAWSEGDAVPFDACRANGEDLPRYTQLQQEAYAISSNFAEIIRSRVAA